jgi:recombination protein RecA
MAKKKNDGDSIDTTVDTKESKVVSIEDKLAKEFGDGVFVSGSYVTNQKQYIVPVSPQIDMLTNGGIPFGSFVIPTGPPKVGKTSLSLDMAATALKIPTEFDIPRHLYYFKVEGRIQKRDLLGIHHLAPLIDDHVTIIQSVRGRILYAEDYLDICEQLMNEKPGSIFIMDSMSQLCSKARRAKEWQEDKAFRDDVPTMLSNFCKRICQIVPVNGLIFVGITHKIANTGFGFSPWAEASGNKIQYQVDVKLHAPFNTPWMAESKKEGEKSNTKLGLNVNWECYAAPLQNGQSITKCESKFRFGWGIDKHQELLDIASDLRLIKKGGSWYTFTDDSGNEVKLQGAPLMKQALIDNPKLTTDTYIRFREAMGFEPIPEEQLKLCL